MDLICVFLPIYTFTLYEYNFFQMLKKYEIFSFQFIVDLCDWVDFFINILKLFCLYVLFYTHAHTKSLVWFDLFDFLKFMSNPKKRTLHLYQRVYLNTPSSYFGLIHEELAWCSSCVMDCDARTRGSIPGRTGVKTELDVHRNGQ